MVLDRPMDDLTDDFFAVRGTRDDLVWLPDVLIGVRRTATNVTAIVGNVLLPESAQGSSPRRRGAHRSHPSSAVVQGLIPA